jgi:hypothetical protein
MRKLKITLLAIFIAVSMILSGCSAVERITDDMYLSSVYATHYYVGTPPVELAPGGAETDPVFTAWDKSTGISITESQISDLQAYAPLASPTFTGTVTMPTPFTLGATSVTTTGTQLNYLNAATGTTGTATTNLVFSTSPSLTSPTLTTAVAVGTWTASGTWTLPAFTMGGAITGDNTLTLDSLGHIGIGKVSTVNDLLTATQTTVVTDNVARVGLRFYQSVAKTSANYSSASAGVLGTIAIGSTNTKNWTNACGLKGVTTNLNIVTGATGTITGGANYYAQATLDAGTMTNRYGAYIEDTTGVGTLTNQYGIYLESMTKGATLNYSIFCAGAGRQYFGTGDLQFAQAAAEPSSTTDRAGIYAIDLSAGNCTLGINTETAVVTVTSTTCNRKLPIRINGATYYLMLDTLP